MGTDLVVARQPFGRDLPHLLKRIEQVCTQHFFAIGPVKAFDVGVLIGLAPLDEAQFDVLLFAPVGKGLTGELRTIVATEWRLADAFAPRTPDSG